MQPILGLQPKAVRELLETHHYSVIAEDDYNWVFASSTDDEPILIPKAVEIIPIDVVRHVLAKVGFDAYVDAIYKQDDPFPIASDSTKH